MQIIKLDLSHLKTTFLIAFLHEQHVFLDLLNKKGALENIEIVMNVFLNFCVFCGRIPHAEHIVLLNIPDTALCNRLNRQC